MEFEPNLSSTGPFLLVPSNEKHAHQLVSDITRAFQPPLSAPFAAEVVQLLGNALSTINKKLQSPRPDAIDIEKNCKHLQLILQQKLGDSWRSSPLSIHGKATSHPIWYQLANACTRSTTNKAILLYAGCSLLISIHSKKPAPKTLALHLREMADQPLSDEALDSVLLGALPDHLLASTWPARLSRVWREVIKIYSEGDIPPPSFRAQVNGQFLGAALNPSPAHSAGALDHRQLSGLQFDHFCCRTRQLAGELEGILGILVVRTGLSVDLLTQLPLDTLGSTNQAIFLDPILGIVEVDMRVVVFEPAQALAGCSAGGYRLRIHLPLDAAQQLQARISQHPTAAILQELFPETDAPKTEDKIYPNPGGIEPTWARLRNSAGPFLLRSGTNALFAALLTLDLSLIARSKLHYANVKTVEFLQEEARLYAALGWDAPVEPSDVDFGFGSRVVPKDETVLMHDQLLLGVLESVHPGQRYTMNSLVRFHNQFTKLCGWRLSVLFALRASSRVALTASIGTDTWQAVNDKNTLDRKGHQPVPTCPFGLESISLYKTHCSAMAERVESLTGGPSMLSRWARAVAASNNIRLLCTTDMRGRIHPLASIEFTRALSTSYELPNDVGRKLLENHLRWQGLPAVLIDLMLRHSHAGQVQLSSFNHLSLRSAMTRLSRANERFALKFFGAPKAGLRKD